jgi:DNA invertase Pin-like site-specific DNA recombinase
MANKSLKGPRCAIYTRKSSEEGLDQAFNSLDAQREACEAYIKSQAGEGWRLVKARYDDGGVSGGTMERPALKRLLAEIEAGQVDIVVVYKVDRLTRSLADFAKIVEVFDARGASFVSVTQQFNTTTSMGRLTLNILLSFAQFERELASERIRDKFAAARKKGIWMGGHWPDLTGLSRPRRKGASGVSPGSTGTSSNPCRVLKNRSITMTYGWRSVTDSNSQPDRKSNYLNSLGHSGPNSSLLIMESGV